MFNGDYVYILGTNDDVYRFVFGKALVKTEEVMPVHTDDFILDHNAVYNIALADKVRHESVFRLVVYIQRSAYLLNFALVHDNDGVRHGKSFLLIMCYIYKSDAHLLLDLLQLSLHILSQLEVKRAERFVQKQNLGSVDDCPCNGDSLLLTAGQLRNGALFIALQRDKLQRLMYAAGYFLFG